ncbi:MAG TPA: DUF4833 domain-containing protein [Gammaproteobacteria bacterium]|nr:DUF4833 domain-containing protein [Gammaproteobacteria bacterium]
MTKRILITGMLVSLMLSGFLGYAEAAPPASYPAPPQTKKLLFYLQRSSNSNTIVYEANLAANGQLNSKQPVNVYWLRYNTNGERRGLNFAERNFAYGLNFEPAGNGAYLITLMAYSGRDIKIYVNSAGNAEAETLINNKVARLKRIYIDVSGSGFFSTVNYIELTGIDLLTNKEMTEHFDPDDE